MRHRDLRFQRRHARQRGLQLRACARGVELGAAAGVEARLHQAQRFALVLGVVAGDAQAFLQATQFDVAARDLADDRDLQRVQVGRGGPGLGALRLDVAAHATEQVELPARVGLHVVALAVAIVAATPGAWSALGARIAGGGAGGHRREAVELGVAQQRVGAVVAGQRDAQVVVGDQRLLDQPRQQRVVEALPELGIGLRCRGLDRGSVGTAGVVGRGGATAAVAPSSRANCAAWRRRPHEVRADGARSERERQQRRREHPPSGTGQPCDALTARWIPRRAVLVRMRCGCA